jgi:glutathione peroxidase
MRPSPIQTLCTLLLLAAVGCGSVESSDDSHASTAAPGAGAEAGADTGADATPTTGASVAHAPAAMSAEAAGLYGLDARSLEGEDMPLSEFAGKVSLVVNVASKCGYTPQYEGLQALQARLEGRGFSVLAFPSNEFRGQEPGDAAQIREFCTGTYGVTFPLFEKCRTQPGDEQSPVYAYLEDSLGAVPSWNFCKYVVGKDGTPVAFFESRVAPDDPALLAAIETALGS